VYVSDSTFVDDAVTNYGGGAIVLLDGWVARSLFCRNDGGDWSGGAISVNGTFAGSQLVTNNTFVENRANAGGAIELAVDGDAVTVASSPEIARAIAVVAATAGEAFGVRP
jgi:hypothetical protein